MNLKNRLCEFYLFLIHNDFVKTSNQVYVHQNSKISIIIHENQDNIIENYNPENLRKIHLLDSLIESKLEIITSRISSLLGNNERIFARKTQVVRIDKPVALLFMNQNHLLGYANSYYKFALIENEKVVAVALFSKPRWMKNEENPVRSYELVRYASLLGVNVVGGISKLLLHFIKSYDVQHLMTYTDKTWGEASFYSDYGFIKTNYLPEELNTNPFTFEKWIWRK